YYKNSGKKDQRVAKKRADILANARTKPEDRIEPEGEVWAICAAGEIMLSHLQQTARRKMLASSKMEIYFDQFFSDVFIGYIDHDSSRKYALEQSAGEDMEPVSRKRSLVFLFKFGCIVTWDYPKSLSSRSDLLGLLEPYLQNPLPQEKQESDSMSYVSSYNQTIKQDIIHLTSQATFERLAYSYAFAQSCKLTIFENNVYESIENTRTIPETLARTGKINTSREAISRMIGELFINRFYINLQCDILDTPDVFWEFDQFADYYSSCRSYLEIPKRVELLNQRLDIMKDLYDMLNEELSLQHGYKLEWIVIYLIVAEVIIEVVWNIIIKDVLKLV
ncbi:ACR, YagE family protein, partial [Gregarina niphandrodes]